MSCSKSRNAGIGRWRGCARSIKSCSANLQAVGGSGICGGELRGCKPMCTGLSILKNVTYIDQVHYKVRSTEENSRLWWNESSEGELFERVQEQLRRQRLPETKPRGPATLLKGLLCCQACQAAMILSESRKLGRTYRYYVCTNAQRRGSKACLGKPVRANVIEQSVLSRVTSYCKLGKRHRQEHVSALFASPAAVCPLRRTEWPGNTGVSGSRRHEWRR